MKNKNNVTNYTVQELTNLIIKLQDRKGNDRYAHSYALGCLQSILNGELNGWNYNGLQGAINNSYNGALNELEALDKGVHALQTA